MRILAIGNSFSQDATRYLKGCAKCAGVKVDVVNLYIGGCSLETHHRNMLTEEKKYSLEFNGETTGFYVSLKDALLSSHWDVITVQQVSRLSPDYNSYEPYLTELAAYIRKCAPKARLIVHETWAYEEGSVRLTEELGFSKGIDMLNAVCESYKKAANSINAYGIIPSGEMLYKLWENGIEKVHRDSFHASMGIGRYALALLWLRMLSGVSVANNSFSDFDVPVSEEEKNIAWSVVDSFEPLA